MKYVEEFRDPAAARGVLAEISRVTDQIGATADAPVRIMEICGGHTHAIFRYGIINIPRSTNTFTLTRRSRVV